MVPGRACVRKRGRSPAPGTALDFRVCSSATTLRRSRGSSARLGALNQNPSSGPFALRARRERLVVAEGDPLLAARGAVDSRLRALVAGCSRNNDVDSFLRQDPRGTCVGGWLWLWL